MRRSLPKMLLLVMLFLTVVLIYWRLAYVAGDKQHLSPRFGKTSTAYFNYLLSAFLHGRLNVTSPITYDLSHYKNKWYLYWGPAPIVYVAPFFAIWRSNASDVTYTLIAGILNTVLFYFVMQQFIRYFKLKLSQFSQLVVWLSFAFASPNLYMSMIGTIWYTDQLVAVLYLLISLLTFFYSLNHPEKKWPMIVSMIFFNLAWLSRYTLIFYGLIYFYPKKFPLKTIAVITAVFFVLFFAYNYFRFGSIWETGLKYQSASAKYLTDLKSNTIFSWKNFRHNFTYYFFNHLPLSLDNMTVKVDLEGNSVFSVYPLTLFFFAVFQNKLFRKRQISRFLLITLAIIAITLTALLLTLGTGWVQFGNRYFYDAVPLIFLLVLFVVGDIPTLPKALVILYGIIINIIGTLAYYTPRS